MNQPKYDEGYISKIIELINDNIVGKTSARAISLLMGINRNYLSDKQLREGNYEQYNKYFTLATNFLLLDCHKLNFCSDRHFEIYRNGSLEMLFQEMTRKGVYSNHEGLVIQRKQFKALVFTLYAINKAMTSKYSQGRLNELKSGKLIF